MKPNWGVFPVSRIPEDLVEEYWQLLYVHGWLEYRMCSTDSPAWEDVKDMISRHGENMYMVYDVDTHSIVAEFMFENFTGKAAQVHFSTRPTNERAESLDIAIMVTDMILSTWKDNNGNPYLNTIYGLTPAPHKAALRFIQKAGFNKIGVLPSGMKYRGNIVDGIMTIKER